MTSARRLWLWSQIRKGGVFARITLAFLSGTGRDSLLHLQNIVRTCSFPGPKILLTRDFLFILFLRKLAGVTNHPLYKVCLLFRFSTLLLLFLSYVYVTDIGGTVVVVRWVT